MTDHPATIISEPRQSDAAAARAPYEDVIMSSKETAKYLKTTPEQMCRLRRSGNGPAFGQVGHLIRYRRSVVDQWLASKTTTPRE